MFLTTWDDTGDVGIVNLTKAELKELTIGISSDKGENITRFQNIHRFHWYRKKLSGIRREILMETDHLLFKLLLRFDICCVASEEWRVVQIDHDEDPSVLYHRSM